VQALEAALQAGTVVQTGGVSSGVGSPALPAALGGLSSGALAEALARLSAQAQRPLAGQGDQNRQADKQAFLAETYPTPYLPAERRAPASPYEIKSGTIIPAVMISGVNSDLPGMILAQVSQDVYDTATGRQRLIPQGTRLVGRYDSSVAYGQKRVLVAWHRLIFPDASSLELGSMPGTDGAGYAGFTDKVDTHFFRVFGSAFLMSLIGAAYQLSQPDRQDPNSPQVTLAEQIGQQMHTTASQLIRKNLNVQPTLNIRPGYRFNVFVTQDVALTGPY
jgi:type IV secretion system protein VirB10